MAVFTVACKQNLIIVIIPSALQPFSIQIPNEMPTKKTKQNSEAVVLNKFNAAG